MVDPILIEKANAIIERLRKLDEALANSIAFFAIIRDLQPRDHSLVHGPHITAVAIVRGGILRAAISTVIACADPSDWRGNRASVGQIIADLKDDVLQVFDTTGTLDARIAALREAEAEHKALHEQFQHVRDFRNRDLAHLLVQPSQRVGYDEVFDLLGRVEQLVMKLFAICGQGQPRFVEHRETLESSAKTFWDTYFKGMTASAAISKPTEP